MSERPSISRSRGLLRAHIVRRADRHTGGRQCAGPGGGRERFGDTEIRDHHATTTALEQDVVGFTSRWMMPSAWRRERVRRFHEDAARLFGESWRAVSSANPGARRRCTPSRSKTSPSGPSPTEWIGTMWGWDSRAAVSASRRNRRRISSRKARSGAAPSRDLALQPFIPRHVHHAHAAPPDLAFDRVGRPRPG